MSVATLARTIVRHQARNALNLVRGWPVTVPSLGSMTLDHDDVALARLWLRDRSRWDDDALVQEFEAAFARWNGSTHAFAFMGGRVAFSACLAALDGQAGDEIILPGYTCIVVPNAIRYAGLVPIFADIELDSYGLDVAAVAQKITSRTRAIVIQHLFGLVCRDYEALLDLAHRHGLRVIEDCAHTTGARYRGQRVGNRGDLAFYSSEQSKIFNTVQGGIATTNDPQLAQRLSEYWRKAPQPDVTCIDAQLHNVLLNYYRFKDPQRWWLADVATLRYGRNELISTTAQEERGEKPAHYGQRMPAPIAALGLSQLAKIDNYNQQRRLYASYWDAWSEQHGYRKPLVLPASQPVFLRYPVLVEPERKQNLAWAYRELGIRPGVWFVSNQHPVPGKVADCPQADEAVRRCINLPCLFE